MTKRGITVLGVSLLLASVACGRRDEVVDCRYFAHSDDNMGYGRGRRSALHAELATASPGHAEFLLRLASSFEVESRDREDALMRLLQLPMPEERRFATLMSGIFERHNHTNWCVFAQGLGAGGLNVLLDSLLRCRADLDNLPRACRGIEVLMERPATTLEHLLATDWRDVPPEVDPDGYAFALLHVGRVLAMVDPGLLADRRLYHYVASLRDEAPEPKVSASAAQLLETWSGPDSPLYLPSQDRCSMASTSWCRTGVRCE